MNQVRIVSKRNGTDTKILVGDTDIINDLLVTDIQIKIEGHEPNKVIITCINVDLDIEFDEDEVTYKKGAD